MSVDTDVVKWLETDRALSFLYVAFATCVVYDHVTTLDMEIALVWKRKRWSAVQFFFLINRYVGDSFQLYTAFVFVRHILLNTVQVCGLPLTDGLTLIPSLIHRGNFMSVLHGYLAPVILWSMQGIMMYRISSMCEHNRKIILLLGAAFIIEAFFLILIPCLSYRVNAPVSEPAPGIRICSRDSFPHFLYTIWIPILFFESLLLSLSFGIGIRYFRVMRGSVDLRSRAFRHSLLFVLVRDSITFPFIAVSVCLSNLVVWILQPVLHTELAFAIAVFTPCILGPRLVLNLQEAYYQPFAQEVDLNARGSISRRSWLQSRVVELPTTDISND